MVGDLPCLGVVIEYMVTLQRAGTSIGNGVRMIKDRARISTYFCKNAQHWYRFGTSQGCFTFSTGGSRSYLCCDLSCYAANCFDAIGLAGDLKDGSYVVFEVLLETSNKAKDMLGRNPALADTYNEGPLR